MDENDVRMTGTYQQLLADDGPTRVEALARALARKNHSHNWPAYLDAAKSELLASFNADPHRTAQTAANPLALPVEEVSPQLE